MRWYYFFFGLMAGALIVWGYLQRRRTLRRSLDPGSLDDAAVERIIRQGSLQVEEHDPLDLDEIARAEEEFWQEERWDPAEEDRI